jgi:hypothetical protein
MELLRPRIADAEIPQKYVDAAARFRIPSSVALHGRSDLQISGSEVAVLATYS